ncbi:hypothetical protein UT300003_28310 [Clostridium sardiniense]|uniref:ATP cone domain-containing protein n=1 Tax=Clostridium sardiniense TaxID=29369 RepID=UPI00195CA628|nr:ATP cone domain-containing protein [Clostridium sardiniense]MBM7833999.1 magnesium-transporting ATPase (P-type) [Clostridium sardiniense]
MRIINKHNEVVPFDFKKLKKSIFGAFEDANFSYTEGDLDLVSKGAEDILKEITNDCRSASYNELINSVVKSLNNNGFKSIALAYEKIYKL